jgi:protein O-GlcNAc transferase
MSVILSKVLEAQGLLAENKVDAAAALLAPLAVRHPKEPNIVGLYSIILFRQRKYPQSLHYARQAVALVPDDVHYVTNLALLLMANQKAKEARTWYLRALELNPNHVEALLSLANEALTENNPREAAAYCRRVLDQRWEPQICPTYMAALAGLGEIEGAIAFGNQAIERFPNDSLLLSNRCSNYNYAWNATPAMAAAAHRAFGEALERERPDATFIHKGSDDDERPLRIGFVSSDLRSHSVSYFIEPFLRHHDRERFEVFAYSTTRHEDATSKRLRDLVKGWRACGDLIDIEVCRLIEADAIDILVDLNGLTQNNSATVFVYKPAPVQVTYCGYPNTTGLRAVDWRVVDAVTDPTPDSPEAAAARAAGQPDFDERCTERLWRLDPCFLCYSPPRDAPEPRRDPLHPGPVFGSFNANKKIVGPLLENWAELLRRVPASRFVLKTFEFKDEFPRDRVRRAFEQGGVDPCRVEILGPAATVAEHLAVYGRVDVAMDTMPYNGTTTTCEALWMGVPVVTVAGATHAARVSASLLRTAGAPELVAPDVDAMLEMAATLATSPERLAHYRTALRPMLAASPLCDAGRFAASFGEALRGMWKARRKRAGG